MDPKALRREASQFADRLSDLLNRSICNGIRISSATSVDTDLAFVGYGVGRESLSGEPVPVSGCLAKAGLHVILSYTLSADDEGQHLMVRSSVLGLCLDAAGDEELFHADYERHKADGYAEAHLQVEAASEHWSNLLGSTRDDRTLNKLHLPAGGRRFRTTVEDVVEFLISERLVNPRVGWEAAVKEHRNDFEERQLKAAVRRNPAAAIETLRELGHLD